jgi:uncharacterized protein YbjT (DUF2867 family)
MSRVAVIGATGHVGTYLVPRLVRAGHDVVALSRGEREPYSPAPEWRAVERLTVDRDAAPRYSALLALHEVVRWLAANGRVDVRDQDF